MSKDDYLKFKIDSVIDKELTPEQKLWCEVVWRAVYDVQYYISLNPDYTNKSYVNAKSAQGWIRNKSEQPQSFIWCINVVFGKYGDDFEKMIINKVREDSLFSLPKPVIF